MSLNESAELVITPEELARRWEGPVSEALAQRVRETNLRYHLLDQSARDEWLLKIFNAIVDPPVRAGAHRQEQWEKGWGENLEELSRSARPEAVIPRYFGKHEVVRWAGDLIRPLSPDFEYHILSFLVQWMMENFLADAGEIFEFGCGPGYHLLRARSLFPDKPLHGADWTQASQNIIRKMGEAGIVQNLHGHNFDFLNPDPNLPLSNDSAVYSVAALEQIGDQHESLIQFLLAKKPRICVHIEPIDEALDESRFLDRLSCVYARNRNYLKGYLPRLRELESEGRVRIHAVRRTWTGSLFIEGHSLIVWSPV